MNVRRKHITVFTSASDTTLPHLAVTLQSINDHANGDFVYDVRILTSGIAPYNRRRLRHMTLANLNVTIVDINARVEYYRADLEERLTDYIGEEIFYPFFISAIYPRLAKALYIEPGTLFRCDADQLYSLDVGDAVISGFADCRVKTCPHFSDYTHKWVGVPSECYVGASVLFMDLSAFRKYKLEEKFTRLIQGYNFDTVSPAADYLNFLCRGCSRVITDELDADAVVAFDPLMRPWHYPDAPYADEFWDVARRTPFYEDIRQSYVELGADGRARLDDQRERFSGRAAALSELFSGFFATLGDNYLIAKK